MMMLLCVQCLELWNLFAFCLGAFDRVTKTLFGGENRRGKDLNVAMEKTLCLWLLDV